MYNDCYTNGVWYMHTQENCIKRVSGWHSVVWLGRVLLSLWLLFFSFLFFSFLFSSFFFFWREVNDVVGWLIQARTWLHLSSIFLPPNHSTINAGLDKGCAFCDKFASELFCIRTQLLADKKTRARERNLPSRPRHSRPKVGTEWPK